MIHATVDTIDLLGAINNFLQRKRRSTTTYAKE
jgi:hypothetical protein